ncbi:MAG: tail fiber domain-containing protein [Bacteroidota bacterium]
MIAQKKFLPIHQTLSFSFLSILIYSQSLSGQTTVSIGTGQGSTVVGVNNAATADSSTAFGLSNLASDFRGMAFGSINKATGERSSAFGNLNEATEFGGSAFGSANEATEILSSAFGYTNDATENSSSAFGCLNNASGVGSSAFGIANRATEFESSAFGCFNQAIGESSSTFGYFNNAKGERSSAFGTDLISNLYAMTVVGVHNDTIQGSKSKWIPTEPVFMVGNGSNPSAKSTALTILKDGKTGVGTMAPTQLLSVNGSAGKTDGGMWSNFSDRRLKKNIRDFDDGLSHILRIRPVRYQYNGKADLPTEQSYVGVVAQEIQKIAPYTVSAVTYEEEGKRKEEYLTYNGTAVVYMLVNAVQEQQAQIKDRDEQIAKLEEKMGALEQEIATFVQLKAEMIELKKILSNQQLTPKHSIQLSEEATHQKAYLQQNSPNPFNGITTIAYFVPDGVQQAMIQITDISGKVLERFPISQNGEGTVEVDTTRITTGQYFYSLILEKQVVDTKQMVLIK